MGADDLVWLIDRGHPHDSYIILPNIYLGLGGAWTVILLLGMANTYSRRRWQTSPLQWTLVPIPLLKLIVAALSFVFWYSCLNTRSCSFWVAFGVYVAGIFLETACLVAFLLLAYGYCLTQERLTAAQQRTVSGLSLLFYLSLAGHRGALPLFSVFLRALYAALFVLLWRQVGLLLVRIGVELEALREPSARQRVLEEALQSKMVMFSDFRAALLGLGVVEVAAWLLPLLSPSPYWVRILFRECGETLVFGFIGWTFRSRALSPFFSVFPDNLTGATQPAAPICRIEVESGQWHIGVVSGQQQVERADKGGRPHRAFGVQPASPFAGGKNPFFVIIQNPHKTSATSSPTPTQQVLMLSASHGTQPGCTPCTRRTAEDDQACCQS